MSGIEPVRQEPGNKGGRPRSPNPNVSLIIRLQPALIDQIDALAKAENVSRNVWIARLLVKKILMVKSEIS